MMSDVYTGSSRAATLNSFTEFTEAAKVHSNDDSISIGTGIRHLTPTDLVNYSRRFPIPVQLKHILKVSTVLQFTH